MTNQMQPIFVLPPDTKRTTGKDAQTNNIMAAKAVASAVRTTLGPKGMDKMIVDSLGEVVITNDGATILKEIQIEHPAAKMIVEVAKTQEDSVGDGTTTVVVFAGELLKNAEVLLEQKIHPTVISKGFRLAEKKALSILDEISRPVEKADIEILRKIASTAMRGKGAESSKELLSKLVVDAIINVTYDNTVHKDNIKIEVREGESVNDSELIEGVVLDKEVVHSEMPKKKENAKVLLLDTALEIRNTEIDAKIQITDPARIQQFIEQEENMLKELVDKVIITGADVVICQKGIDDIAQHFLCKAGVMALRRVKKSDMKALARAAGARIVSNVTDASPSDLGGAYVHAEIVGTDEMVFVEKCQNPKTVTILLRGSTEHIVQELKRALEDSIGDLTAALVHKKAVAGAGAPEIELAHKIREYASVLTGREQLAVDAFADAMEIIPRTLAENAGLDPIDVMVKLNAAHKDGKTRAGINLETGDVMDAWSLGVIEPYKVKTQAVSNATEVAEMILRIDDVIAGAKEPVQPQMNPPYQ